MSTVIMSNEVWVEFVVLVELQDGTRHIGRRRITRTVAPAENQWEWHQWVVEPLRVASVIRDEHGRYVAMLGGRVLKMDQFSEMIGDWQWEPAEAYGPKLHQDEASGPDAAGGDL
jgi:hypothetical protein